jgi:hypothetical protein
VVFNWIGGGGKVDHPMADLKQARKIIADLPANDASKALEEITRLLESLKHVEGFKLNRRFENVDLLDAASRGSERQLLQEYLATPRHRKSDEHRLWTDVYCFWRELGEGYLQCLQQYETGNVTSFRSSLPIIVGRALRALRQQLKWTLLRYGLVEPRVWTDLARLYQFAEAKGFTEEAAAVYPGTIGRSTVKQEFLKALMLAASSTDSLHPVGQVIAARLVSHFSETFVLVTEPREGCTHWFDLAAPKAPVRIIGGVAETAAVRYFGAGLGLHEIEQLRAHIAYTRSLPEDLDLPGTHDNDVVMALLKHLEQNWAGKTQARRFERRKVATRVTVVPGLAEIIRSLEFAINDSLDFSHQQAAESWIVEDLSEGGYGAVIPAVAGDWVEVGSLVGVEGETFRDWRVGVIRRVARNEQQQQRVGVQLLTQAAALAELRRSGSAGKGSATAGDPVVLLSSTIKGLDEVELVLRKGVFEGQGNMELSSGDENCVLALVETLERGRDYDRVRFKVMQATV